MSINWHLIRHIPLMFYYWGPLIGMGTRSLEGNNGRLNRMVQLMFLQRVAQTLLLL